MPGSVNANTAARIPASTARPASSRISGQMLGRPAGGRAARRWRREGFRPGTTIVSAPETAVSGPRQALSSRQSSSIEPNRSRGSFAIARLIAASRRGETSGRRSRTLGGGSLMCCIATATKLSPENGTSPVSSSYSTAPSE